MAEMSDQTNKIWLADIIAAIRDHGGQAIFRDIYRWIQLHRLNLSTEYKSIVRSTIYTHSTDAESYVTGNPDIFRKVELGEWALRFPRDDIPTHKMSDNEWFLNILFKITPEELKSYSGKGGDLIEEARRRVRDARARYNMKPPDA